MKNGVLISCAIPKEAPFLLPLISRDPLCGFLPSFLLSPRGPINICRRRSDRPGDKKGRKFRTKDKLPLLHFSIVRSHHVANSSPLCRRHRGVNSSELFSSRPS